MKEDLGISRRTFLRSCALSGSLLLPALLNPPQKWNTTREDGRMEDALSLLAKFGPEYGGGLANHAPMVADALIAMGRSDAVLPWLERYSKRLEDHPKGVTPIMMKDWKNALGDYRRLGDWVAFFQNRLQEQSWKDLIAQWIPMLAPGMAAAAAHGLLRTAHIVRELSEKETPPRVHELAEGLGYWAARYQTLPVSNLKPAVKLKPSEAIREVQLMPQAHRGSGFITTRLESLKTFEPFGDAIHLVDDSMAPDQLLSDLTRTFARIYLMNPRSPIAFVHAVTGPGSIRILLPYLPAASIQATLRYGWQLAAAIYSAHADNPFEKRTGLTQASPEDLVDRAVAAQDEHAIKFTEVCLREYQVHPDPAYLIAAQNACDALRA